MSDDIVMVPTGTHGSPRWRLTWLRPNRTRRWCWRRSTPCSTDATTPPPKTSGPSDTSSTVPTSHQDVRACSTWFAPCPHAALRAPAGARRGRLRYALRPFHRHRQPRRLGRGRRGAHRERPTRRALGRPAERGDPRRVGQRPADVRRPVPARPLTGPPHGHGLAVGTSTILGHLCCRPPPAGSSSPVPRLGHRTAGRQFNSSPGTGISARSEISARRRLRRPGPIRAVRTTVFFNLGSSGYG